MDHEEKRRKMDHEEKDPQDLPVTPLILPQGDHAGYVRGDGQIAFFDPPRRYVDRINMGAYDLAIALGDALTSAAQEIKELRRVLHDTQEELDLLNKIAGTVYPKEPVIGQRFYRVDDGHMYSYTPGGWVQDGYLGLGDRIVDGGYGK